MLVERFDADRMNALATIPDWDDDGTLEGDLAAAYTALVAFFRTAAERGEAVLLALA